MKWFGLILTFAIFIVGKNYPEIGENITFGFSVNANFGDFLNFK